MPDHPYPILEYDDSPRAVIEPGEIIRPADVPERCVLVFFQEVITRLRESERLRQIDERRSEIGPHPVYELRLREGGSVAVMHPGVGAPLAAALLEELIALGCKKFIACGGAGVLDREIAVGHVFVPTAAVRDEGTSYHYLPPSREVPTQAQAVAVIERVLQEYDIPYLRGKTWTTDAFFRETEGKVRRRLAEGCLTVEMEAAAFFAVAQFRGVAFGQMLYTGDDVSGQAWDTRMWQGRTSTREKLFWLAAEACLGL